ncbi:MAG TPA: YkgJ family cysteine cluster protein [Polyangiaceae bacterium]|nr:YkgJ family cysteine cluster protein [Polyangiaceae bacterium]
MGAAARFDCQACGACCTNPDENRREGFVDYVEVDPRGPLARDPDRGKRFVVYNAEGRPHLRLDPSGRCAALRGRLGASVRCAVYALRPRGCRLVEPASLRCLQARRERGLDAAAGGARA